MALKNSKKSALKFFSGQLFITALGLLLILLISFPLYRHVRQRSAIDVEIAKMENEVRALEEKNSKLKDMIDYLKSDEFLEEQARLKLGLAKEGEKVFIVKKEPQNKQNNAEGDGSIFSSFEGVNDASGSESNPVRWFKYFFH
jgi:cell division protein DivIC